MIDKLIPPLLGYYTMAGGAAPWVSGPLIVGDSFTAANGTNVHGRTPDVINTPGNTWNVITGAMDIQTNKLNPATYASSIATVLYDIEVTGFLAKLSYYYGQTSGTNSFCQLLFRYQDATHFLSLTFGTVAGAATWKLTTANGGTYIDIDSDTFTFANNTPYAISLQLSGNDITATINGGTALTATSVLFPTATTMGLLLYQTTTITNKINIDDFQVYTL